MTCEEMLCRLGYANALAVCLLDDDSYARRHLGRAEEISMEQGLGTITEVQQRLVTAGILWPDEDPWAEGLTILDLERRMRTHAGSAVE